MFYEKKKSMSPIGPCLQFIFPFFLSKTRTQASASRVDSGDHCSSVAATPTKRIHHVEMLMTVQSLETQVFVLKTPLRWFFE